MKRKSAYKELEGDYNHLMNRTLDLFKYGYRREGKLETAVANAWKQFERISKCEDAETIKNMAISGKELMERILKEITEDDCIDPDCPLPDAPESQPEPKSEHILFRKGRYERDN